MFKAATQLTFLCAGLMMLRFNINPALMRCHRGCFLNTSHVAQNVRSLVNSFSFNLTDIGSRNLYVHHQQPAFYSWTGQRLAAALQRGCHCPRKRRQYCFQHHRRTGQGAGGGQSPPWIWETSKIRADGMGNSGIQGLNFSR